MYHYVTDVMRGKNQQAKKKDTGIEGHQESNKVCRKQNAHE
jgi:hypothetical protein